MSEKNNLQKVQDGELKDFLDNVHLSNKFRKYGWLLFGLIFFFAKLLKIYPISWLVVCILFAMLFQTIAYFFLVKKTGKIRTV